jgi:hypothetical protein
LDISMWDLEKLSKLSNTKPSTSQITCKNEIIMRGAQNWIF